jgi:hypothetical protein
MWRVIRQRGGSLRHTLDRQLLSPVTEDVFRLLQPANVQWPLRVNLIAPSQCFSRSRDPRNMRTLGNHPRGIVKPQHPSVDLLVMNDFRFIVLLKRSKDDPSLFSVDNLQERWRILFL